MNIPKKLFLVGLSIAGAAIATVGSGAAAERPVIAPTRDVVVTYAFSEQAAAKSPSRMRVSYADANRRVRLDMFAYPDATVPFSSIIFDVPGNQIFTLLPAAGSYYVLPAEGRKNPGLMLNEAMDYTRIGDETIAGVSCTGWTIAKAGTPEGTACVTPDGVTLRATRLQSPGGMEAIAVEYRTPAAALFAPGPGLVLKPNTPPEPSATPK